VKSRVRRALQRLRKLMETPESMETSIYDRYASSESCLVAELSRGQGVAAVRRGPARPPTGNCAEGAYFCGSTIFRPGDIEEADESKEHQPVITRDGECICLAVTEGPLRFTRWLPRIVQPLIGL
jgi:hypothetical protein